MYALVNNVLSKFFRYGIIILSLSILTSMFILIVVVTTFRTLFYPLAFFRCVEHFLIWRRMAYWIKALANAYPVPGGRDFNLVVG